MGIGAREKNLSDTAVNRRPSSQPPLENPASLPGFFLELHDKKREIDQGQVDLSGSPPLLCAA
jgi:hypothetical protein